MQQREQLQADIEQRLGEMDPPVELVALEQPGGDTLRLFIDREEGGVDLALCEQVTRELRELLIEHSLEVSSPGADRLLTKPEHFRRFTGRKVRVRTADAVAGRRNFTGTIKAADDESVSVEADGADVRIPLKAIRRSNLVPNFGFGGKA
jgi:ribosome maturation factor RimP